MSSADVEFQRDELDALTSILEDTAFELHDKSTTNEPTRGTLVVEVALPDEFYIQFYPSTTVISVNTNLITSALDQHRRVQHLPPIVIRFTLPDDYPSVSPPSYQLECIWMSQEQVKVATIDTLQRISIAR